MKIKKICILGDEKKVSIAAEYSSDPYPILGTGNITITSLADDQKAAFATATTPVIVSGSKFTAMFTVVTPASNDKEGPDKVPFTNGSGKFNNNQTFVRAK